MTYRSEMNIISRDEAMSIGLTHYYTGKPCKRGHLSYRFVSTKACVECGKHLSAESRKRNVENIRQRNKAFHIKNKEQIHERQREYYKANKDAIVRKVQLWGVANADKRRANWHNRRARKIANGGQHTAADIRELRILQRNKCACCGEKLATYHVDHIVPLVAGGSNDKYNLQLLCPPCNLKKKSKDPITFMQQQGRLL